MPQGTCKNDVHFFAVFVSAKLPATRHTGLAESSIVVAVSSEVENNYCARLYRDMKYWTILQQMISIFIS
jgi:hypothetical protein